MRFFRVSSLSVVAVNAALACGGDGDGASSAPSEVEAIVSEGSESEPSPEPSGDQPSDGVGSEPSSDAMIGELGGTRDDEPVIAVESCVPTGDGDGPDEDFLDTNCDGIDGDAGRAVFVSNEGFDDAPGTRDEPVQTLGRAIQLAAEDGRDVYVCNGSYRENLTITAPVSVYGGYDCARNWQRIKDRAVVESGLGVPLRIQGVTGLVRIERMAFRAADAIAAGQSSQAAAIVDSQRVELVRVELVAGDGAAGEDGRAGTAGTRASGAGASGVGFAGGVCERFDCDRFLAGGAAVASHECRTAQPYTTRGGPGGRGGNVFLTTHTENVCRSDRPADDAGLPGSPGQYLDGSQWRDLPAIVMGRNGLNGGPGALGAAFGSVQDGIYMATNVGGDGADGTHGEPGAGGRGGTSQAQLVNGQVCYNRALVGGGGGQGGSGGCAGEGARGGQAGGGAIALVIVDSGVKLELPRVVVGNGGAGGRGAPGGTGAPGAPPGAGGAVSTPASNGASGQPGGVGGNGGDGGGGGGGPSIAILYSGLVPEVSDAVYDIGLPGVGGPGSSLGSGAVGVTGEIVTFDSEEP